MNTFSDEQKEVLLKCNVIKKITDKQIIFKSKFKIKAVEAYFKGASPDDIFINAGLDISLFVKNYPNNSIRKWQEKYLKFGKQSFDIERRGTNFKNHSKKVDLDKLTYEELRAVVDIQKEVIEELKKKRALVKK